MIDLTEATIRIGVYWGLAALGFAWFAVLAVRRFAHEPSRLRASIVAFAATWATLCANNALYRLGAIELATLSQWEAEVVRAVSVVSLLWLCWEFRAGRAR